MKKRLLLIFIITLNTIYAESSQSTALPIQPLNSHWQITLDNINLPNDGPVLPGNSTFVGGSYLLDFDKYFYAGINSMASISGGHGGFFILGFNAGIHLPLGQYFFAEAGSFLGAGGGYSSLVGGGLFVQPYADAGLNVNGWQVAARYSYLRTPDHGRIQSHQIGLLVNIPTHLYVEGLPKFDDSQYDFRPIYAATDYLTYFSNTLSQKNIQQIGFELGYFFNQHIFGTLSPAGAFYTGTPQNGYMEIFAGLGYLLPLTQHFALNAQAALGAAGGGSSATKDGGMLRLQTGVQVKLNNTYAIEFNAGYLNALTTHANAGMASAKVLYYFGYPHETNSDGYHGDYDTIPWQVRVYNQSYLKPKHTHPPQPSNIQLSSMQADLGLTEHGYVTAAANVAYHGLSGGYATFYLGGGVRSKSFADTGLSVGTEMLIGVAGAGYMAVGDSLLFAPTINAYYKFNHWCGLFAGGGQMFTSKKGNISTPIINVGLTFNLNTITN